MHKNPLLAIDFYKADHRRQYPEGTNYVFSNLTPRSDRLSNLPSDSPVVFFGLQYYCLEFLQDCWGDNFFMQPKEKVVADYKEVMDSALGPDAFPLDHIEALHDLGYLPIKIRALPEGSTVKHGVPVLTIENTHPDFFWLVNYLETSLSAYLWKMCTSATTARWYRSLVLDFAQRTASEASSALVPFQCHDFSFRGMSGLEDAAMSGAAHLLFFSGTDTVPAIDFVKNYYSAEGFIGGSVPATEHSVMCMGSKEGEFQTFEKLIKETYPSGIVSIVSDTWDFWKVMTEYLPALKDDILARDGKVVIRPDSGDPVDIICGTLETYDFSQYFGEGSKEYESDEEFIKSVKRFARDKLLEVAHDLQEFGCYGENNFEAIFTVGDRSFYGRVYIEYNRHDKTYYYIDDATVTEFSDISNIEASQKGAIEVLWDTFGGTVNEKGYKELDSHVGLIYGDSITPQRAKTILERLEAKGFASTNVVFGIGSYTYNYTTRDTHGFAVKATYGEVKGKGREIFKDPATDNGTKKSAKGLLKVVAGELKDEQTKGQMAEEDDFEVAFEDGNARIDYFDDIRLTALSTI